MKTVASLLYFSAVGALLAAGSPEVRDLIESGNSFYRMGLYDEAGKQYLHAAEIDHDSAEVQYNLGNVYHQKYLEAKVAGSSSDAGKQASAWESKAVSAYKQAVASTSTALRARALFNLGNTYAEASKREDAITAYREALRILPGDEDTKHNLELLLRGKKIPALVPPNLVEPAEPGKPVTNVIFGSKVRVRAAGSTTTHVTGMAEASGGPGAGAAAEPSNDSAGAGGAGGGGQGAAAQAGGGAGSNQPSQAGGGAGSAGSLPGAGGEGGVVSGSHARVAVSLDGNPDKALKLDETAASASSQASSPKDQDKSRSDSSASTDQIDPKRKEVLDKASKAEQRYIDQWSRPPDLKKPKEQDW